MKRNCFLDEFLYSLGFYERTHDRYTITKLTNEVSSHYQNQFMKQLHVLVLGLDVLGNPFGVIRGVAWRCCGICRVFRRSRIRVIWWKHDLGLRHISKHAIKRCCIATIS